MCGVASGPCIPNYTIIIPPPSPTPESVQFPSSGSRPPIKEWILVGVATSSHLGSVQRMREKMVNMQQRANREVEGGRDLQMQLKALQDACQELQQFLQTSQWSLQRTQDDKQALEGVLQESQQRVTSAEQRAQEAGEQVQVLQQTVDQANVQIEHLQQRVHEAEHRAEGRVHEASLQVSRETEWEVRREEIMLTDEELGRGGWAVVRVATFRATRVAAKCIHEQIVSNYNRLLFIREMNMAARVRHPNLLQFIGATLSGEMIILTELMPTSVRQELENEHTFSPNQITSISLDVARALNYLHLMLPTPIIHRDISSANVLLEPGPTTPGGPKSLTMAQSIYFRD